ncbi:hypothetical protein [Acetobacter oeni]|uniref:Uncharacterized protein n=1 Tax=Acetobacter oeni TaxID=304077 RepID=A0A511XPU8_9PROT|nr:hypothetical protein [Acetobacter oeni]MBB3884681.1 hypothetical protein [Acetobacter oeni]NHO20621.1 hypothetical protein [Acetobacter oeni]GBR07360.1 hypothetical protein AA21952_2321 [Acetobacter oeni LMG 21952]GEN64967.1 hypothetical protein AOE01nite_31910 [Acetobacter oeni]
MADTHRQDAADLFAPLLPELALSRPEAGPDPRLVELARLLARRAAREWFEAQQREQTQRRS